MSDPLSSAVVSLQVQNGLYTSIHKLDYDMQYGRFLVTSIRDICSCLNRLLTEATRLLNVVAVSGHKK